MGKFQEIMQHVGTIATKAAMKLEKHSPTIFIVVGTIGVVAGAVVACTATTKAGKIVEDAKNDIEKVHEATENGVTEAGEEYNEEDSKKDLAIVYVQTGIKFVKLYAPALIVEALSIACILASHGILQKRNVALSAAYSAIGESFKTYRGRVTERFGEQVDNELKYGLKARKVEEIEVDPETGKNKKVKKTKMVADPNLVSDYAVYFDRGGSYYDPDVEYSMAFITAQQNFCQNKLSAKGFLFLNEALRDLGLPETKAGQIVGWTKNGPDGYVNFRPMVVERELENGEYEPVILLDFNVEGNIWEKM